MKRANVTYQNQLLTTYLRIRNFDMSTPIDQYSSKDLVINESRIDLWEQNLSTDMDMSSKSVNFVCRRAINPRSRGSDSSRSLSILSTLSLHRERYPRQVTLGCPEISHCMSKRRTIINLVDRAWLSAIQNATKTTTTPANRVHPPLCGSPGEWCSRCASSPVANRAVLRHPDQLCIHFGP